MSNDEVKFLYNRIVFFFDILGFEEFFKKSDKETIRRFFYQLDFMNSQSSILCAPDKDGQSISHFFGTSSQIGEAKKLGFCENFSELKLNLMSDTIILSYEYSRNGLISGIFRIFSLQRMLLTDFKLLIRGGITRGDLIYYKNNVTGVSLKEIAKLEKKANYPRIILDTEKIRKETLGFIMDAFIKDDKDEVYFINYLVWYTTDNDEKNKDEFRASFKNCLEKLVSTILEENNVEKRKNLIEKKDWLINYGIKMGLIFSGEYVG